MADVKFKNVIDLLSEISEDTTTPKNVKGKMLQIIAILREDVDDSIKKNKVLYELDEIADDNNMQQYIRTQIWNVVSLLEKL